MSSWRPPPPPQVPEVGAGEVEKAGDDAVLIDVRQHDEYISGHIPGAVLIPLDEVMARVGDVPLDRPVYVVCESGPRSARATQFYRSRGIDARNVTGGTKAWIESNRPVVYGPEPQ